jgi:putative acetyltransferase
MTVTIRLADNRDIVGIERVIRAVYEEYEFTWDAEGYHMDLYDIEEHYLGRGHPFYVAETYGRIVGTAALTTFARIPGEVGTLTSGSKVRIAGTDCSLERLYVDPDERRMGIGSALLATVVAEAKSRGATAMEIWSDKKLKDAHRLYEKNGAKLVGDRICSDPDESPEWGMILSL